jgi:hypothetical protein
MSLRKLAWAGIFVLLIVSVAGVAFGLFGKYTVVLPQHELQSKIDAKLPHTTKNGVTIASATLDLSGDTIGGAVHATTTKARQDLAVKGQTKGTLTYKPEEGAFYFRPDSIRLDEVSVNGHVAGPRTLALTQKGLDKLALEATQSALERFPVYRLPDTFKGDVTKLVLDSVEVKDGNVVAHLSFWRLTTTVFLYGILFVVAIILAFGLMMNPEALAAVMLFSALGGD